MRCLPYVEDSVKDLTQGMYPRASRSFRGGDMGLYVGHSAPDKSVWYAPLMLGTLPSRYLRIPFRTVSSTHLGE
jgi:hypothetical protein